jgi:hypothetical protein
MLALLRLPTRYRTDDLHRRSDLLITRISSAGTLKGPEKFDKTAGLNLKATQSLAIRAATDIRTDRSESIHKSRRQSWSESCNLVEGDSKVVDSMPEPHGPTASWAMAEAFDPYSM